MSDYLWFEGIPFPDMGFETEVLRKIRDTFVIRDTDTIILAYPKSGTNWLAEILCLIKTKGDPTWIQSTLIWKRSPCIETWIGYSDLKNIEDPHFIMSHLPIHLFPKTLFSSKAKVIYLVRNPRDVFVSGYFFWGKTNLIKKPESMKTYFEWFLRGKGGCTRQKRAPSEWLMKVVHGTPQITQVIAKALRYLQELEDMLYGSWFVHTRGWMSMRERDNFLLLSYEEMKKDTRGTIEKICQFLGKQLEPEEMELVLKHSSFQAMRENDMSNYKRIKAEVAPDGVLLTRKGTPEDWKNHFTVAQAETFDRVFQEEMRGFPPGLFPWE